MADDELEPMGSDDAEASAGDPDQSVPDALGSDASAPDALALDAVAPDGLAPDDVAAIAADPAFARLLNFLKESRAFDFTGYKRPSLVRRVRYRMREVGVDSIEDYQDLLQLRPDEFTALFNTILINVTSFFRDPDAWDLLAESILPELLRGLEGGPVRVWSAGCSAGQEPYSMAILLAELMGTEYRDRVKIYATDIDEHALDHARQASYTGRELAGLPDNLRDRYFESGGGRYVLAPDLRRNVIFGRNDMTQDAPISRIDVLLCRNTLMYFNAETQSRVVSRLGFALRPKGVLFLGKAEMLLNHAAVFSPIDLRRRFFRKTRSESTEAMLAPPWRIYGRDASNVDGNQLRDELILTNPVAQFAVGTDGRLLMVNHRASTMLGLSQRDVGRPFSDLEVSYRPLELRTPLARVAERRELLSLTGVEWRRSNGEQGYLDVYLVPLMDSSGEPLGTSVSLTDVTRFRQLQLEVETANRQLETAYEELQSTNEELETTNEELQSTVEELETTNEELQSTNEELETMNEELQSANDELQITNDQLRDRTVAIGELNDFMQTILSSLDAAVIVVNRELRVQVWSRQAEDLWGLRESETVGHQLTGLDSGLPTDKLRPWLQSVFDGPETGVYGQHVHAVNRRGRPVELRVTVTPMVGHSDRGPSALLLFEELTNDDIRHPD